MTMQKCFHMGNLKECGVTTKLKLRDAMKRGAAILMPVVLSQISDLFATKVHLYVARYVQAIKCEFKVSQCSRTRATESVASPLRIIDRFFSIIATHLCKFQTICPDFESLEQETAKACHQSPKNRSQVPRIQKMQAAEIFLKL